jgi:hypothetical protein
MNYNLANNLAVPCVTMRRCISVPNFIRARELAKKLKVDVKRVTQHTCTKDHHVYYFEGSTGATHAFKSTRAVILPFEDAYDVADRLGVDCALDDLVGVADSFDATGDSSLSLVQLPNDACTRTPGAGTMDGMNTVH